MRYIAKETVPPTWFDEAIAPVDHIVDRLAAYDELDKRTLRLGLATEGNHLCCYCQRSVANGAFTIEHHTPQRGDFAGPDLALSYHNLFIVCVGKDYEISPTELFCDQSKRDQPLHWSPLILSALKFWVFMIKSEIYYQ